MASGEQTPRSPVGRVTRFGLLVAVSVAAFASGVALPPARDAQAQQADIIPVPRPRPTAEMMALAPVLEPGGDIDVPPEIVDLPPAIIAETPPPVLFPAGVLIPGGVISAAAAGTPLQLSPLPTAVDPRGKIEDRLPLAFAPDAAFGAAPLDLTRGLSADLMPGGAQALMVPTAPLNLVNPAFSAEQPRRDFRLEARLMEGGPLIPDGVSWRVFAEQPGEDGKLPLIAETAGGQVTVSLPPGAYLVHAAFGRAGATKRIEVTPDRFGDELVFNAGGLQLHALVGRDIPLPAGDVVFDIFADDEDEVGERTLLLPAVAPDAIVRLNAGTYHVVSRYGDTNAVVRADIEVRAGNLTEATIYHQAARVTLRLVSGAGRDALPNTAWSVVTPGGDSVFDSVGAFPSVVLAAGEYTAVGKHDGEIFEGRFRVESGVSRDIEVIAENPVVAAVAAAR